MTSPHLSRDFDSDRARAFAREAHGRAMIQHADALAELASARRAHDMAAAHHRETALRVLVEAQRDVEAAEIAVDKAAGIERVLAAHGGSPS